ncbi:MAG: glycosyltransferase family 4 protein [Romboutsia sp.]
MKKGLVLAHFPSPYRVDVFKELAKVYDLTIYFEICEDQNRNSEWFIKDDNLNFKLINKDNKGLFKNDIKNIDKYDFILAYDYHTVKSMWMQLNAIKKEVPYFINCDGAFIRPNAIKDKIKKFFFSRAALLFASGDNAKRYFTYFGANERKIYIHDFTSLHSEDILNKRINDNEKFILKGKLGLGEKKMVLSIGQFIERKGFDVLLDSWKHMDENTQLVLIGGGELEANYRQFIKENSIKNIKILGFKNKKEIIEYYKAADLFVLPTREDIWGLVINEAMANGLPIITTNRCIAGLELVENGVNGFIVNINDSKELYYAMIEILNNDILAQEISNNNISKIKGKTVENIGKSHIEVINNYFNIKLD